MKTKIEREKVRSVLHRLDEDQNDKREGRKCPSSAMKPK
ncbi:hypothetical protein J2S19_002389 [Metabacillus malikii]|uniref:Uncharacterized protein n=1 Tax=Metabacillus malikii TaxID=1504265 RepID=A0ABT9ZH51_9BACI|nr:hypothetical protein [Metabacillus malikii]